MTTGSVSSRHQKPFTIDIDTGGTFTDGFIACNGEVRTVKVPTTPHDLTICFQTCIKAAAEAYGIAVDDLLYQTKIVRFSNTIGTNTIIERAGSKIGLLVTKGSEDIAPTTVIDGKTPLVEGDMVAAIAEKTATDGSVELPPDPPVVLAAAQDLIDKGARCLVVALENSGCNPANERQVRDAIRREYSRDYLGSVPVYLASDISPRPGRCQRINTTVINAYIHAKLSRLLYGAGEDLRQRGYPGTLFIGHNNGTVARVAKTRAINTYNSGPTAGLLGAREVGRLYGEDDLISIDMGGTSFDIGHVIGGQISTLPEPDIGGFPCNLPMISVEALGAGGGSIARLVDGELRVGPESAGALPGPACFALGGDEPTVTDANLVLGLLDPGYFLGGGMQLDMEAARTAIGDKIAEPLEIAVEEAAWRIKARIDESMAVEVTRVKALFAANSAPVVIAYGGAGPLHASDIAGLAGLERVVVTAFSAVQSAFSSSLVDIGHLFYEATDVTLAEVDDLSSLADAVAGMRAKAERDLRGEGFLSDEITAELELFICNPATGDELILAAPVAVITDKAMLDKLRAEAQQRLAGSAGGDAADLKLTLVGYRAMARIDHHSSARATDKRSDTESASKGTRRVYCGPDAGWTEVPVYDRALLSYGHQLAGPAVVESDQTTLFVCNGWRLEIDEYSNAVLRGGQDEG